jgi:8-oxo-dGTP diphosphatase
MLGFKKIGFGQGKFTGVGGKCEPGESANQAALRELYEETGVRAALADLKYAARLIFMFPFKAEWSQIVHVFLLRRWEGTPLEGREVRPEWYDEQNLPHQQMWQDARWWLPKVLAGEKFVMQFVFAPDNETVISAQTIGPLTE